MRARSWPRGASRPRTLGASLPAPRAPAPLPPSPPPLTTRTSSRTQGGRIYDSENGTTCHQCRQKTVETKAKCTSCTLFFCPRCLENRYSETVAASNAKPDWACPRCRKDCNCSNCRKKAGLDATGILAKVARSAGFGCVSDLLAKNPKAKALHMAQRDAAAAAGGSGAGGSGAGGAGAPAPPRPKPKAKAPAAVALVDDAALGPRPAPMPAARPLGLHRAEGGFAAAPAAGGGGGGAARRVRPPAWLSSARAPADGAPLPPGVDASELACVLEFAATFGAAPLGLRALSLPALAAELAAPEAPRRADQLCPVPEDSAAAALHVALLRVVRAAWGVDGGASLASWQAQMRAYWAAELTGPAGRAAARAAAGEHVPAAVAGELFVRPPGDASESEEEAEAEAEGAAPARGRRGVAAPVAEGADYPAGGYWALPPGARVAMAAALCHDALDTYALRGAIEAAAGGAAEGAKGRRSELAEARREAREAAARAKEREIATLIAGGSLGGGLTLEEQRAMLGEAQARAEAATAVGAAAKLASLEGAGAAPRAVRAAPLGVDRDGRSLFALQAAAALTGRADGLVALAGGEAGAPTTAGALAPPAAVAAALDPRGRREGPLRCAIAAACRLPASALAAAPAAPKPVAAKKGKRRSPAPAAAGPASPAPVAKKARAASATPAAKGAKALAPRRGLRATAA
jgi:hypothetical protein